METNAAGIVGISIIIPVFNEEKRITRCLERVVADCKERKWDFEVIVVEDGSSDNTSEIVNRFHLSDNRIKLLSLPIHLGKGGSVVVAALVSASKDYVAYMDADLAADPSELEKLLNNAHEQDIVIGSRILRGDDVSPVKRPFYRTVFSHLYSRLFRILFRIPIYDPQCGIKLFRKEVIPKLFKEITINGFAFDTDIIVKAFSTGLRVKEVPVNWTHGKSSTLNILHEIRTMGLDILSIWYNSHLIWQQNDLSYAQKKATLQSKLLFALLSRSKEIKYRHLKYHKDLNEVLILKSEKK